MQSNDLSATVYDQPNLSASPTSMSGIALCNKDQAEILAPALIDNDYHDNTISVLTADSSLSVGGTSLSGKGVTVKSTECYMITCCNCHVMFPSLACLIWKNIAIKRFFIPSSQDQML